MQKEDARKQLIRMHRKGVGVMQIVEKTGLSWTGVNTALRLHGAGAAATLKPGSGRSLSPEQEQNIAQTICDKRPEQLKMDFALWSRPAVRQHIELSLGIKLSIRAVGNYLARWGFTPKKPIKKAYEQRPEAVQARLGEQYMTVPGWCRCPTCYR